MASGGRVLHHLRRFAPDPRNAIVFAGYQAGGTRGAALVGGARTVRIFGEDVPVNAEVAAMQSFSSHADAEQILAWLRAAGSPPAMTFLTHGDPDAADTLRARISRELRWRCRVPDYRDRFALDGTPA
jgi:metallo-beta-lactamase family protein